MTDTETRIYEILHEFLDIEKEKITKEARFKEDLGCDSLDMIEMVMAAEDEFDVVIDDDIGERWVTVGDAVSWIDSQFTRQA